MAIEYVFVVVKLKCFLGPDGEPDADSLYYQDPILTPEVTTDGSPEFSANKSTAMVFTTVKTAVRVAEATGGMVRVLLDSERPKFGGASEGNRSPRSY